MPDELTTLSREAEIPLDDNGRYYATVFDAVTGVTSWDTSAYVHRNADEAITEFLTMLLAL